MIDTTTPTHVWRNARVEHTAHVGVALDRAALLAECPQHADYDAPGSVPVKILRSEDNGDATMAERNGDVVWVPTASLIALDQLARVGDVAHAWHDTDPTTGTDDGGAFDDALYCTLLAAKDVIGGAPHGMSTVTPSEAVSILLWLNAV